MCDCAEHLFRKGHLFVSDRVLCTGLQLPTSGKVGRHRQGASSETSPQADH